MPYHKSSVKRVRQTEKRTERNRSGRTRMRSTIKNVLTLKTKEGAAEVLKQAVSVIDKSLKAGLIHKNNAANKKSRLTKFVSKLA